MNTYKAGSFSQTLVAIALAVVLGSVALVGTVGPADAITHHLAALPQA